MRKVTLAFAALAIVCLVADTAQAFGKRKRRGGGGCDSCGAVAVAPVSTGCGGCGGVAGGGYGGYVAGGGGCGDVASGYYHPGMAYQQYGVAQAGYIPPQTMPGITPGSGIQQASANEVKIRLTDSTTDLSAMEITAGTTVRWINDSKATRMVSSAKGDWTSNAIAPGQDFVATFTKPGTFEFFCGTSASVKDQKGTLVVK